MSDGTIILSKEERRKRITDYKNAQYIAKLERALEQARKSGFDNGLTVQDLIDCQL